MLFSFSVQCQASPSKLVFVGKGTNFRNIHQIFFNIQKILLNRSNSVNNNSISALQTVLLQNIFLNSGQKTRFRNDFQYASTLFLCRCRSPKFSCVLNHFRSLLKIFRSVLNSFWSVLNICLSASPQFVPHQKAQKSPKGRVFLRAVR